MQLNESCQHMVKQEIDCFWFIRNTVVFYWGNHLQWSFAFFCSGNVRVIIYLHFIESSWNISSKWNCWQLLTKIENTEKQSIQFGLQLDWKLHAFLSNNSWSSFIISLQTMFKMEYRGVTLSVSPFSICLFTH